MALDNDRLMRLCPARHGGGALGGCHITLHKNADLDEFNQMDFPYEAAVYKIQIILDQDIVELDIRLDVGRNTRNNRCGNKWRSGRKDGNHTVFADNFGLDNQDALFHHFVREKVKSLIRRGDRYSEQAGCLTGQRNVNRHDALSGVLAHHFEQFEQFIPGGKGSIRTRGIHAASSPITELGHPLQYINPPSQGELAESRKTYDLVMLHLL
jgi:hypothetical protein